MFCPTCGKENVGGATSCAACGAALGANPITGDAVPFSPSLQPGAKLQNGAFTVGKVLGQGGFGITYKGGDMQLRRYVAIKEFFPQGCARHLQTVQPTGGMAAGDYQNVKAKFLEEARVLARFNHPGIARVFTTFEENNTAYMVMEMLEGKTLQKRLEEKGALPEKEAVSIIEKVGEALITVHAANLIHRDLKPDNIMLTDDGRVVLIDFGTARAFAAGKTVHQTAMLTPGYAPLEQYGQSAKFGAYSDVYALGATLYHCLTGQLPPPATDRATGVELKSPEQVNPYVHREVSNAVMAAMQLKADARPQTIKEFLDALKGAATNTLQPSLQPASTREVPPQTGWTPQPPAPQSQPLSPVPNAALWISPVGAGQVHTNAEARAAFDALCRAFQSQNVRNTTPDLNTLRVTGNTGVGLTSYGQQVNGQVIQGANGTTVTVASRPTASIVDWGRGTSEVKAILTAFESNLRANPTATAPAPTPAYYPSQPMPQRHVQSGRGGSVLFLGLLGLFCCGICAPIAWIMGNNALRDYGDIDPGDRGTVAAGRVLGIIGTVIWGSWFLITVLAAMGNS